MNAASSENEPQNMATDDPLPGLPGSPRVRLALVLGLVCIMIVDSVWWGNAVFGNAIWRTLRWIIVAVGLGIGGYAFLCRGR
jgi:hypothetical protein